MIGFLINTLKIIIMLGFLVFIHEGGHFLVAKFFKVKVNEFAIGFGPTIFKKQKGETKYALRLIPLGGFVSMEGEEERSDKEGSFSNTSIPKRILIVIAGATVNIIFGILTYLILVSCSANFYSTTVDYTIDDFAAKNYGIISGDKIIKINNKKVKTKNDITKILEKSQGENILLTIVREDKQLDIELLPTTIENKDIGILFSSKGNNIEPKIAGIEDNSPASAADIQNNDIILEVNNKSIDNSLYNAIKLIQDSKSSNVILKIKRQDKIINAEIKPNIIKKYYLGIVFNKADNNFFNNIYYGVLDTKDFSLSIIDNLKQLFTGKVSANQMVGIVGISDIVVSTEGLYEYIYIIALISLSLGVTNLLPIPPLDGGKVLIYIIEAIRKKPLKEETEIKIQTLGFSLLIVLSIYVTYNDVLRII